MRFVRPAVVLTAVSLVLPGAALAQSPAAQSPPPQANGQNAEPLTDSAPSSGSSSAPRPPVASTAPRSRSLPSTGADAGLLALAGAGLLLTGAGLRLRLQEPAALAE